MHTVVEIDLPMNNRTSWTLRRHRPAARHPRGFTLLELMVTLAIIAILTRVAAPSVIAMMKNNRTFSEANTFVGDLQFARAEAVKRGQPVTVCPSSNGTTCVASSNNWEAGWIVFSDPAGNGTFDSSADSLMRVRAALRGGDTFRPTSNAYRVTFNREGFSTTPSTAMMWKLHSSDSLQSATRCVTIEFGGRPSSQTYGQANLAGTTCN